MVGRPSAWLVAASFLVFTGLCVTSLALSQQVSQDKPPSGEPAKPVPNLPSQPDLQDPVKRKALIDKMIADYDLTPHPLPAVPDNPPPHEGALVSFPNVVEPPDLVVVEILEALPGRPVSGERLVRPDGTIALGFYGNIQVRGLTLPQIKVAIIKQMRNFIQDDQLGLVEMEDGDTEPPFIEHPARPEVPGRGKNPFEPDGAPQPPQQKSPFGEPSKRRPEKAETAKVPRSPFGLSDEEPAAQLEGAWKIIPPEASLRVYVDVSAYNTMNYYVTGDVVVPGRMPYTGTETVLDALNFAGGLLPTAEPREIRLVRPARGGKPGKVYKVDLEAIQEKGDVTSNYQIFPGDRLIVGRNEVAKLTVEVDRLAAPIETIVRSIQSEASMLRNLQSASPDRSQDLYTELVDFWLKQLSRQGELKFDEKSMREALIRKLKLTPPAKTPAAK
jgi:protein involved in polysaccharide export with SLBB domain